jgi:DNA mismatch repair protein MutS
VVRREVVRLVTPGTLTEDALLDARTHNYLAAWAEIRGDGALAWADISTGDLNVMPCPPFALGPELYRLSVREVLVQSDMDIARQDASRKPGPPSPAWAGQFRLCFSGKAAPGVFGVASLDAFGIFSRAEVSAMGALADYLELTQKGACRSCARHGRSARRG